MFLNELSMATLADDVQIAQRRIADWILTLRAATAGGVQRTIHLPATFHASPIAEGYYWQSWLNDGRVERELKQFFLALATKLPFLEDDIEAQASWAAIDCLLDNQQTSGLKGAYVTDGIAVSFLSGEQWNTASVECEIQEIVDEDIVSRSEILHHASRPVHIEEQAEWIAQRLQSTVATGTELWQRVPELFPSLVFCPGVEQQMEGLETYSLPSIMRALIHLNSYCLQWQEGAFQPDGIQCVVSPESQPTLQQYGDERTFRCPNGIERTFSWHAKVGRRWRIYFDPSSGPGSMLIGYVGAHLRTVKFN